MVGSAPAVFGCTVPPAVAGRDPGAVVEAVGAVVAGPAVDVVGVTAEADELVLAASMVVWSFDDPPQAVSPIVAAARTAPIARCMSLSPLRARPCGVLQ